MRLTLKTVEWFLKLTGVAALAASVCLSFAEARGWSRHADRQAFLEWALNEEGGLSIEDPVATAFVTTFPPRRDDGAGAVTHVTKWKSRIGGGPVLDVAFNYLRSDQSRTSYVATLADVREWAAEPRYRELPWILGLIGLVEVAGGMMVNGWTKNKREGA